MSKLLTFAQLNTEKRIGYTRTHIMRLVKDGKFPAPKRIGLGNRSLRWIEQEIDDWIQNLLPYSTKPRSQKKVA